MRMLLDLDIPDGVIVARTAKGRTIHLVSDPKGGWFVIEQLTLDRRSSHFTAHRVSVHPSISGTVARFSALD